MGDHVKAGPAATKGRSSPFTSSIYTEYGGGGVYQLGKKEEWGCQERGRREQTSRITEHIRNHDEPTVCGTAGRCLSGSQKSEISISDGINRSWHVREYRNPVVLRTISPSRLEHSPAQPLL